MPKKFFIHELDSYTGRVLCRLILAQGDKNAVVCGTLAHPSSEEYVKTHVTRELVSSSVDLEAYKTALLTSSVIVFDCATSPEDTAYAFKVLNHGTYPDEKVFVCVSNVLAWTHTYPPKPSSEGEGDGEDGTANSTQKKGEDEDAAQAAEDEDYLADDSLETLTEDMYHRRKPHPTFRRQKETEKLVFGGVRNARLTSFVVFAGLLYGEGEDVLHSLFRTAWLLQPPSLPIYGSGKNSIPMIHVRDLCNMILKLVALGPDERPENHYLIAVDASTTTLGALTKCIAQQVGTGRTHRVPDSKNELLMLEHAPMLSLDLKMEAGFLRETLGDSWHCESGPIENFTSIILPEFRAMRRVVPVRVVVTGPPASGKTTLSAAIAKEYKLPHLTCRTVVSEYYAQITAAREAAAAAEDGAAAEDDDQALPDPNRSEGGGGKKRWTDSQLISAFKWKLATPPCRNFGYVLDGFPKTYVQCRMLFSKEFAESEDRNERVETGDDLPELLISLSVGGGTGDDGTQLQAEGEEELRLRVRENAASDSDDEARFERRLEAFKKDKNGVAHFLEVHQVRLCSSAHPDLPAVKDILGAPRNYGLTPDEAAELEKQRLEQQAAEEQRLREEQLQKQQALEKEQAEQALQREKEREMIASIKAQEKEILEIRAKPLRKYLLDAVVPTLTRGLLEVAKAQPKDPIDFLAEYLFRNASTGLSE